MVAFDIPHGCTLSPGAATPQLTINHNVAADLDSSNAFEGPEKLLEVWFAPGPSELPASVDKTGLKAVPHNDWVDMLDLVNCKILSVIHSDTVDAYLLSESSMFVFPHKIILKTCGTTTLLLGLHRLLRIAATKAGFAFHNAESIDDVRVAATPYRVFYSRKNFLFPDRQQGPHRSWKQEVKFLDDMFENGSAYMVGKMNGDHWYLYITAPPLDGDKKATTATRSGGKIPTGAFTGPPPTAGPDGLTTKEFNDETLEILMTDLDPENAKQFYVSQANAVAGGTTEQAQMQSQTQTQTHASSHASRANDDDMDIAHMSDSSISLSGSEEIFDVDDVGLSSGTMTPTSEQTSPESTTEGHGLGTVVANSCGLADVYPVSVYPDARIDAYMFSPCGFSANGVVPAAKEVEGQGEGTGATTSDNGHYFTVHVTPEPHCSFASFETNVPGGQKGRQTADIVKHVVDIFRPGRFSVTLFEAKGSGQQQGHAIKGIHAAAHGHGQTRLERIPGYRRIDRIVHDFEDYDLVFRYYERDGWVSDGEARVGEL